MRKDGKQVSKKQIKKKRFLGASLFYTSFSRNIFSFQEYPISGGHSPSVKDL